MSGILLAAINARHSHTAFGARYLLANMVGLRGQTTLLEFTIQQPAQTIADAILAQAPAILGMGVYIWNASLVRNILHIIRKQQPEIIVLLGGPEITSDGHAFDADYFVTGEGDLAFADLCRSILDGNPPTPGLIHPPAPDLSSICLPYEKFSDVDLAHRTLYVESSRGCAMQCDYCVSAGDNIIRVFPLPELLAEFDALLKRGARSFKFCDRSFNIHPARAVEILSFFRERLADSPGLFLHFEMLPDRFPPDLLAALAAFPERSLQLEIGLQSFDENVLHRIRRPQDLARAAENLRHLRTETNAYIHADLIAGLPGETPEGFAHGFDRLAALRPHEIQVGILKKLPGTALARHDDEFDMQYNPQPPYEIRSTRDWPAEHLQRTARFAHYWDAIVNSGRFIPAAPLLWAGAASTFDAFMRFADWMGGRHTNAHGQPLADVVKDVFIYLTQERGIDAATVAAALIRGYRHAGAKDIPAALAPHLPADLPPPAQHPNKALRRQHLHWNWMA